MRPLGLATSGSGHRRMRAAALAITLLPIPVHAFIEAPFARADCGRQAPSTDIRDYRGQAFTGRVASLTPPTGPGTEWTITFEVDEVLAGAVPSPYTIIDSGGNCGTFLPQRLAVGEQVLLSVGGARVPEEPGRVFDVLSWRRVPNGWRFDGRALWGGTGDGFPPEARAATTRGEILGLIGAPALPAIPSDQPALEANDDVDWTPVEGVLGGAAQGVHVQIDELVAWSRRVWALEERAIASSSDDERVVWDDPASWRSSGDGRRWSRSRLPRSASDELSLTTWDDKLALIEQRYLDDRPGVDVRVWTNDGEHGWRQAGRLRVRAVGRYRGCALTGELVAATARTLVVTASCLPLRGAGGSVGPGIASAASAQRTTGGRATYPTYSWTSTDGRHWTSHRLFTSSDELRAASIIGLWSVGMGVAAVVDRGARQDLLWSADGASFATVAALPVVGSDVAVAGIYGVALVPRDDGRVQWLALLSHPQRDANHPEPGTGLNLWRLDPAGTWTIAHPLGGDATAGALATDGRRVAVIATVRVPEVEGRSYRTTSVSADAGRTFTVSEGSGDIGDECLPSLAILSTVGVTTCHEPDGPVTRQAVLWSETTAQ